MSEDITKLKESFDKVPSYEGGAKEERIRLMAALLSERTKMAADYKNTIRHTGGLLTQSMTYAYSKGLEDAFKLISKTKEANEEQD